MESIKLGGCFDNEKNLVLITSILLIVLTVVVIFEKYEKYNDEWIIGKTKEQIVEQYGDFEWYVPKEDTNGQIICYIGMYTVKPKIVFFKNKASNLFLC